MATASIDVSSLTVGSQAANSLNATYFSNPNGDVVAQNTFWTTANVKYIHAPSDGQFVIKTLPAYDARDAEITTWTRQGYVYLRLDSSGRAIYFFHNGEVGGGQLDIGIATGVDESAYTSATTFYPLYRNTNLAGSSNFSGAGYTSTNTDGQTFTFGVSGFDIYVKYKGTEVLRFKEYRQMSSGAVALKVNGAGGYGFRGGSGDTPAAIVWSSFSNASLYSDYANSQLDMRDFNLRSIQTTGSIGAGSSSLTVANATGFQLGDWVIVEIGAEAGAGARGTVGVGGSWPAYSASYADSTAMNADGGQPVNTFTWTRNDGVVYQWNGSTWTTAFTATTYYVAQAIPFSLHGRITGIAGLVLTIDTTATVATTNANVYLDNQPYVNYLTARQSSGGFLADLSPITPTGVTVSVPAGTYAGSGRIVIGAQNAWTITGAAQSLTTFLAPKGTYSLCVILAQYYSGHTAKNFTLQGNFGLSKFGLASSGWTYIPGGLTATGLMAANPETDDSGVWLPTSPGNLPSALLYPPGVLANSSDNCLMQDLTVNDVSQAAICAQASTNVWAYRCTNHQADPFQHYVQWMYEWSGCTGGGACDCTCSSSYIVPGFESFSSLGTKYIRPRSVNALFSLNNAGAWIIQDAVVTFTSQTPPPVWSASNSVVNVSTSTGSDKAAFGGLLDNMTMDVTYIGANNDISCGVIVNIDNPNITIRGGSYIAPDYLAPGISPGPQAVRGTGANMLVDGMVCRCATLASGGPSVDNATIGVATGTVQNCKASVIYVGSGSTSNNTGCVSVDSATASGLDMEPIGLLLSLTQAPQIQDGNVIGLLISLTYSSGGSTPPPVEGGQQVGGGWITQGKWEEFRELLRLKRELEEAKDGWAGNKKVTAAFDAAIESTARLLPVLAPGPDMFPLIDAMQSAANAEKVKTALTSIARIEREIRKLATELEDEETAVALLMLH